MIQRGFNHQRRKWIGLALAILILGPGISGLTADRIILKSGEVYSNVRVLTGSGFYYVVFPGGETRKIAEDQIRSIEKGEVEWKKPATDRRPAPTPVKTGGAGTGGTSGGKAEASTDKASDVTRIQFERPAARKSTDEARRFLYFHLGPLKESGEWITGILLRSFYNFSSLSTNDIYLTDHKYKTRRGFAFGADYTYQRFSLDLAYLYSRGDTRHNVLSRQTDIPGGRTYWETSIDQRGYRDETHLHGRFLLFRFSRLGAGIHAGVARIRYLEGLRKFETAMTDSGQLDYVGLTENHSDRIQTRGPEGGLYVYFVPGRWMTLALNYKRFDLRGDREFLRQSLSQAPGEQPVAHRFKQTPRVSLSGHELRLLLRFPVRPDLSIFVDWRRRKSALHGERYLTQMDHSDNPVPPVFAYVSDPFFSLFLRGKENNQVISVGVETRFPL